MVLNALLHLYAHYQELETILVLCNALDGGGRLFGAEQQAMFSGRIACCPAPNSRPRPTKALHTIRGNNTSIVSSSWWRAYKCPKHVEQIRSAIQHSVASSWCSSLRVFFQFWWMPCKKHVNVCMRSLCCNVHCICYTLIVFVLHLNTLHSSINWWVIRGDITYPTLPDWFVYNVPQKTFGRKSAN